MPLHLITILVCYWKLAAWQ